MTASNFDPKTWDVAQLNADRTIRGLPRLQEPTPQTTIEAVMFVVRERGVAALKEPATLERLRRCDEAARGQIDTRIDKLIAAGRIASESVDA